MAVFDHPLGHLRALQVAKGFYSTQHCFDDVCGACVVGKCGLVHIPHGGLQSNWTRAFSKMTHSHSLHSSPGVVQEQSKTLCRSASARRDCTGGGKDPKGGWRPRMGRWRSRIPGMGVICGVGCPGGGGDGNGCRCQDGGIAPVA